MSCSGSGRVGGAGGGPTVTAGIVLAAGVQIDSVSGSAPDNHFAATPNPRVRRSAIWRADGAGGCPAIGAGVVSAAGVQSAAAVISTPDDHFAAGPHCRVTAANIGRVGEAGGCPTVGTRVVFAAGVKEADWRVIISAPDDHFAAGPDCRVPESASGRVGGARWSPCVVSAANRRTRVVRQTRYYRKRVVGAHRGHCYRRLRFRFSQP